MGQLKHPIGPSTRHLCTDMQRLFSPDGPWPTPWMTRVLPVVEALTERAPYRTIFTRFMPPQRAGDMPGRWQAYYTKWAEVTRARLPLRALSPVGFLTGAPQSSYAPAVEFVGVQPISACALKRTFMPRSSLQTAPPAGPDLFGNERARPQGLRYETDTISAEEERALINRFASLPLAPFQFGAFEGKRRVASFGFRYDFSDQRLHQGPPFPEFIKPIAGRVESLANLAPGAICHILFTEYETSAGIGWHRDKAAFDVVLGLSLGSACPFRFRRKDGSRWKRYTLNAEPRSLYSMSGEARSVWEHSIAPVAEPRWSITFRTMAH